MQKFVPQSCVGIFRNDAPDSHHWTQNSCFGTFHRVWVHLGSFLNCMKLGAKWGELVQLIHKFVPRSHVVIFAMNTPDPPHWTLNSCLGAFHSVWVHLESFHNCMKLGAKRDELVRLMQKFVPRSHIGICRNEQTRSTPLDPKLMFRSVL